MRPSAPANARFTIIVQLPQRPHEVLRMGQRQGLRQGLLEVRLRPHQVPHLLQHGTQVVEAVGGGGVAAGGPGFRGLRSGRRGLWQLARLPLSAPRARGGATEGVRERPEAKSRVPGEQEFTEAVTLVASSSYSISSITT